VNFDSYTDRVVGIAAALVNTLTPGERQQLRDCVPLLTRLTTHMNGLRP